MFRVDAHHKRDAGSSPSPPQHRLENSLYCCLNTALDESDDGLCGSILFTVGRKDATVIFDEDKCVSRKHCCVRLKYSDKSEEFQVYVQDMGSKFGTFIYTEADSTTKTFEELARQSKSEEEDATLSIVKLATGAYHKLPLHNDKSCIVVRCGVAGSQALIRITRCDFNFCYSSSASPKEFVRIMSAEAYKIGARISTNWEVGKSTHLISKKMASTAKMLCACACKKPIVTPEWVIALLDRKESQQPLPDELQYVAPWPSASEALPIESMDLALPRDILRSVRIIALEAVDISQLCISGGAKVTAAFDMTDGEFFGAEGCNTWLDRWISEAREHGEFCVFVELVGKRISPELKRRKQFLEQRGLPITNAKEIATSISQQKPLKSSDGNDLICPIPGDADEVESAEKSSSVEMCGSEVVETTKTPSVNEKVSNLLLDPNGNKCLEGGNLVQETKQGQSSLSSTMEVCAFDSSGDNMRKLDSANLNGDVAPRLRTTADGWMMIAPKNRELYVNADRAELPSDVSEFRNDLVIRTGEVLFARKSTKVRKLSKSVKDFKKFKKNKIIRKNPHSKIIMQSVLPKQSDVQKTMEFAQQELDRDQEAAEALFMDHNVNSGIKKYMSQQKGMRSSRRR